MVAKRSFFAELKRRNVLRAAAIYAATAWLLVQIVTQVFPVYGLPAWSMRWVIGALAIGFPFWLAFAWFYELTPEGFKRESELEDDRPPGHSTSRKLDFAIIGVLAVAVVVLLTNRLVHDADKPVAVADKSIAVMPFANTSGDPGNEYFSDGLSEELINTLGELDDLKVIGRNSSFQFKGKPEDSRAVGARLGVAYLLEGSVRKAENRVRIAVQLVRASDGSDVWSQTYDRELEDIFAVQSEIARAVTGQLQSTLLANRTASVGSQTDAPPSGNLKAYNAVLQGNFYLARRTAEDVHKAVGHYEQAVALDPAYALAYARLAYARADLLAYFPPDAPAERQALVASARGAAAKALQLAPQSADAYLARGWVRQATETKALPRIESEYRKALALAPQSATAALRLGMVQMNLGRFKDAEAGMRRVLVLDPLSARAHLNLAITLLALDRHDESEAEIRKAIELQPQGSLNYLWLAIVQIMQGDAEAAVASAQRESDPTYRLWGLSLAEEARGHRAESDKLLDQLIAEHADGMGSQIATSYAQRGQPDAMLKWLEHALETEDPGVKGILFIPFFRSYQDDPRFVAFARKVGVMPAPGQAELPATSGR